MTSELATVLQISAIGTGFLFAALAGLIGLMYLLTGSWLFNRAAAPADDQDTLPVAEPVIDDNKRTIEVADVLYGVTMERKGISKLVAVEMH